MTQAQLSAFIQNQPRQPSPEEMIRGEEAAKQMAALRDSQGLIDMSGMSTLPFKSAFIGLQGIQLAKGADLARKASWAAERAKNAVDAKKFASGLALGSENIYSVVGAP